VWDGLYSGPAYTGDDISAYYYLKGLDAVTDLATRLGKTGDATRYASLASAGRAAYTSSFFNASAATFGNGQPVNQVLALDLGGVVPEASRAAVQAKLLSQLTTEQLFPGHNSGGILQTKLLWPVLTEMGRTDLAYDLLLATDRPSYAYMISLGATTVWESWSSNLTKPDPSADSYNHIMFGGQLNWMFNKIGGLGRERGSRGWRRLRLAPVPAPQHGLTEAAASVDSPLGPIATSWQVEPPGICGLVPENAVLTLTCNSPSSGGAATFDTVVFASFGTPGGTCGNYTVAPSCNSPNSTSVVAAACLGKSSCSVTASNDAFGGDPCYNTVKSLAVQLAGKGCESLSFSLAASVPPGATATVVLPVPANTTVGAGTAVLESGATVFANGAFVAGGAPGVWGAAATPDGSGVELRIGSGSYSFGLYEDKAAAARAAGKAA
jgi:hypothetical protein